MAFGEGNKSILVTTLIHSSGEYLSSYTDLEVNQSQHGNMKRSNPVQIWGSTLTYLRRYAYCAIIGVIGEDEDDDATHTNQNKSAEKNDESFSLSSKLMALLKENNCNIGEFTQHYGITSKNIESIRNAVDNFDELLLKFKNKAMEHFNVNSKDE
jgi:hypothetical protein